MSIFNKVLIFLNQNRYIVATQLESIDARKMFPCLDEVDMKATFSISVQRLSKNHIALSNMPKIKTTSLSVDNQNTMKEFFGNDCSDNKAIPSPLLIINIY